ncbi:MAG: tetratricopeptide repeat protein [Chloroflexota bacterium]|nr:tetratricopeptide repeat protein [Chloroflexota bacterium]
MTILLPSPARLIRDLLPVPPTVLIGRDRDVAAVIALVREESTRLVSLTGPGGVGKTRLALRVAHDLSTEVLDGVVFVDLAGTSRAEHVAPAIARAFGVQDDPGRPLLATLVDALRGRKVLLVLDNLEQVVETAADIAVLLSALPDLVVLATSRIALRIRAEQEYPIRPLAIPARPGERLGGGGPMPPAALSPDVAALARVPAVALFVDRARASSSGFRLDSANAAHVAAICVRLDGLPLAIELAAARVALLTPKALLERLDRRLPTLTGGPRDLPARQRTLWDAIAWSTGLLDSQSRDLFATLAVFAGGFSLDMAAALAAPGPVPDPIPGAGVPGEVEVSPELVDGVTALLEANLLRRDGDRGEEADPEPRFRMLETIRDFGLGLLEARPDADQVRTRHATLMRQLGRRAEREIVGPHQVAWYARLDRELENLRAALDWAIRSSDAETALRLGASLWRYWATRGLLSECASWLRTALATPGADDAPAGVRAKAMHRLGNVGIDLADYAGARELCEASLALWRAEDDRLGIASALNGLGLISGFEGDYVASQARHEEALAIRRRLDDPLGLGNSLTNLGNVLHAIGKRDEARPLLEEALRFREGMGDIGSVGYAYLNLADVALTDGDETGSRALFERSLRLFREVGDRLGIGYALHILGMVALRAGQVAESTAYQREALELRREAGDRRGMVECVEATAALAIAASGQDGPPVAARLLAAADAVRGHVNAPRPPDLQRDIDLLWQEIGRRISPDQLAAAVALGGGWSMGEAVDRSAAALATIGQAGVTTPDRSPEVRSAGPAPQPSGPLADLSARERDVMRLVTRGLTNGEIAGELFISPRTVHAHVYAIFRKLDVSSRAAATRLAVENGLS